jgi:tetratricopeptide (TPR) repeat protein
LTLFHYKNHYISPDNTDKPLMVAAAMRAASGTPVEEAFKAAVERAGADIQEALQALRQAKRDGDLAKAIAIGEGALELSPANFNVLIELCTLYLLAMNRLGNAQEHTERARVMLALLEERYPHHGRVAAARKFYRERLAAA